MAVSAPPANTFDDWLNQSLYAAHPELRVPHPPVNTSSPKYQQLSQLINREPAPMHQFLKPQHYTTTHQPLQLTHQPFQSQSSQPKQARRSSFFSYDNDDSFSSGEEKAFLQHIKNQNSSISNYGPISSSTHTMTNNNINSEPVISCISNSPVDLGVNSVSYHQVHSVGIPNNNTNMNISMPASSPSMYINPKDLILGSMNSTHRTHAALPQDSTAHHIPNSVRQAKPMLESTASLTTAPYISTMSNQRSISNFDQLARTQTPLGSNQSLQPSKPTESVVAYRPPPKQKFEDLLGQMGIEGGTVKTKKRRRGASDSGDGSAHVHNRKSKKFKSTV